MKTTQRIAAAVMAALSTGLAAEAAIVVPGANGSDGALLINQNTVIDLSQAATGQWDNDNSSNAGKGVYDPEKWAVVFKFSSVTITGGATVTFKNHPSRAPVVWLVSNDVVIDPGSVVALNGQPSNNLMILAEPGPGGFRGSGSPGGTGFGLAAGFGPGAGGNYRQLPSSAGYGAPSTRWSWDGSNAAYSNDGIYGNPSLIPLIGGSGGSSNWQDTYGGGAGGGAILIAAQGSLNLSGIIQANGGAGHNGYANWESDTYAGNGSGGGVRLVSESLIGGGRVEVLGGVNRYAAGPGRVRVERVSTDGFVVFNPATPSVVPLQSGDTATLWVPSTGPSVKIVSIGGVAAPADPRANFGGLGADVSLPQASTVTVVLETTNVEDGSKVRVRGTARFNYQLVEREATLQEVVSTSPRVSRWVVEIPVGGGYAALQARVVRP